MQRSQGKKEQMKTEAAAPRVPATAVPGKPFEHSTPVSLEQLVSHLKQADAADSRRYISDILDRGEPAGQLHAALIAARNVAAKEHGLTSVLNHFDKLQAHLFAEMQRSWQERISQVQSRLVSEAQAHLLSDACIKWVKEGYIELYNFSSEMPLIARVRLLSAQGDTMHVVCSEDLVWVVAAGEQRRTVFVRIPLSEFSLRLIVKQVHGSNLQLLHAGLIRHEREKRHHVRVQCEMPVPISMRREKGPWWQGVIQDYSDSGLGLSSSEALPWQLQETLMCRFTMRECAVNCSAVVRWRNDAEGKVRLGLELEVDGPAKKWLLHEVSLRSREIQDKLKAGGIPESLFGIKLSNA